MERVVRQIAYNRSPRTESIRYIVVHDTGNPSRGADAQAHYIYFDSGERGSSADFFVDDNSIWQVNDYSRYYSWHCGDGGGSYGITNRNSIGVELCVNAGGDYQKALSHTAQLVRELMQELNIPIERVVRHYDASRKPCPNTMAANDWAAWKQFQEMLTEEVLSVSQYEELKEEIFNLTETVKQLAVKVGDVTNPMIYNYIDDNMPEWARDAVRWAVEEGIVQGDGNGLALDDTKLWLLVVLKRALEK